jgi:uncharacterized protein (DUF1501 family)
MLIKRRRFIQTSSLASAALMVPNFLKALQTPQQLNGNKVLVILQLSGGNDGLNTIIPARNDIYYKSRPRLGIQRDKALSLTEDASIHPSLTALKSLYDDGSLGILNSVGYPNPDRSHFRSMDVWHTASNSNEYLQTGWIGRYLDAKCSGSDKPTYALEMDDVLSLALKGEHSKGLATKDPRRLYNESNEKFFRELSSAHSETDANQPLGYLYKTMAETVSSAEYIFQQSRLRPTTSVYPNSEIGRNLKTIASLIFSDINTKVYYLSIGSFDTHVAQDGQQRRLFAEMNEAIDAFVKDLKANHRFDDVILMTFSEFGRRVSQNASGGTDHGTANNMFLIGGGLKQKGLINELPDLNDLDAGDLKYKIDFKNVYATVLKKWLDANDTMILGKQYQYLDFI